MPLYRYECETCGHRFRVLHSMRSDKLDPCPSCGGKKTRRLLSRVSVQFKGSGYYKTDRANKNSKVGTKSLASDNENGSGSEKTADTKSDSGSSDKD
ncbi:FmdB family zinc ribbon protein [Candidatus Bipolaricaulota bacterium]